MSRQDYGPRRIARFGLVRWDWVPDVEFDGSHEPRLKYRDARVLADDAGYCPGDEVQFCVDLVTGRCIMVRVIKHGYRLESGTVRR